MSRLLLMGNSGAGKSTLARRLSAKLGLAHLDLDTIAWLPESPPRRAPLESSVNTLRTFWAANATWLIEGCYADLLGAAAVEATTLVFLNPGTEACLANCRARPFEPHKYASPEAQNTNLAMLLDWVTAYETRSDGFSLTAHRQLFDAFAREKHELTTREEIDAFQVVNPPGLSPPRPVVSALLVHPRE